MPRLKLACAAVLVAFCAPAAAMGSLADVQLYDRSEGRRLQVYWHEGRAWVVGKPGNEYQITVRNRRGEEVLAVMSVDGVNVISGETASPQQSGYVLSRYRSLQVKGWRKDLSRTAAFYFTSLPDSYAARTGRPDNVGAIGVALYRKKRPEPPVNIAPQSRRAPAAEAAASPSAGAAESRSADRSEKLGTGHGRNENSPAHYVNFERATSEPAETVVIYYDSYQNLLARGVVPRTVPPVGKVPNPFPRFVPDPPA